MFFYNNVIQFKLMRPKAALMKSSDLWLEALALYHSISPWPPRDAWTTSWEATCTEQ